MKMLPRLSAPFCWFWQLLQQMFLLLAGLWSVSQRQGLHGKAPGVVPWSSSGCG